MRKKKNSESYRAYKSFQKEHCHVNDSNLQLEAFSDQEAQDVFSAIYHHYREKIKNELSKKKKSDKEEIAISKEKLLSMIEMRKKIVTAYGDVYTDDRSSLE